jgi:hypothetical protein
VFDERLGLAAHAQEVTGDDLPVDANDGTLVTATASVARGDPGRR